MNKKELKIVYNQKKEAIVKRLEDFTKVKNDDIFYELCFCLMTPQSSAKVCWNAVLALKSRNFHKKDFNPLKFMGSVRFHNNKSRYIMEMKRKYNEIQNKLNEIKDSYQLREWFVKNIKGIGYKESSHFLRNIGYRDLAILDRHILKNLNYLGVISEIPKPLSKKVYLDIEQKFKNFSNDVGIHMDELDLLFWSKQTGEIFK